MFQLNASCRDVVAQFQARFVLTGQRPVDEANSAYCQARARLPEPLFVAALRASAAAADACVRWVAVARLVLQKLRAGAAGGRRVRHPGRRAAGPRG